MSTAADPIADYLAGLGSQDLLATLLLAEARGEDRPGREMIALVVLNRAAYGRRYMARYGRPYYWGATVHDVILKPWQFSALNRRDPNRAILRDLPQTPLWAEATVTASHALSGLLPDATGGATGYLNPRVANPLPSWATPDRMTVVHLRHTFYRLV